jgi:hypothetical protein
MDEDQIITKIRFLIWNMSLRLFHGTLVADQAHTVMHLLQCLFSTRGMYWNPVLYICDRLPRHDLVLVATMLSKCQRNLGPGRPDDSVLHDVYHTMASVVLCFQSVCSRGTDAMFPGCLPPSERAPTAEGWMPV